MLDRRFLFRLVSLWTLLLSCACAFCQTTSTDTSSAAIAAAQQFLAASENAPVTTFTAQGSATNYLGGRELCETVQLAAAGPLQTYAHFQSERITQIEQRGLDASGSAAGQWTHGTQLGSISYSNLYLGNSWFFPPLSSLAQPSDSSLQFAYVGPENWNGAQVIHIRVTKLVSTGNPKSPADSFVTDYYLDPQTYLMRGMTAQLSPDDGAAQKIAWEVHYGNYSLVQGVMVPLQIEQYLSGTLLRRIALSDVQVNTPQSQSLFEISQ